MKDKDQFQRQCYLNFFFSLNEMQQKDALGELLKELTPEQMETLCAENGLEKKDLSPDYFRRLVKDLSSHPPIMVNGYGEYRQYYDDEPDFTYSISEQDRLFLLEVKDASLSLFQNNKDHAAAELISLLFQLPIEGNTSDEWDNDFEDAALSSLYEIERHTSLGLEGDILTRILMKEAIYSQNLEYFKLACHAEFLSDDSIFAYCTKDEFVKEMIRRFLPLCEGVDRSLLLSCLTYIDDLPFLKAFAFSYDEFLLRDALPILEKNGIDYENELEGYVLSHPEGRLRELLMMGLKKYPHNRTFILSYFDHSYHGANDLFILLTVEDENEVQHHAKDHSELIRILKIHQEKDLSFLGKENLLTICSALMNNDYYVSYYHDYDESLREVILKGVSLYQEMVPLDVKLRQRLEREVMTRLEHSHNTDVARHYPSFVGEIEDAEKCLGIKDHKIALHFKEVYASRPRMQKEIDLYLNR